MNNKKYCCRFLYDIEGWAYYFRCKALQQYCPDDFECSIGSNYGAALKQKPMDLLLQLAYSYAKDVRRCISVHKYNTILCSSYNVGYGYANNWFAPVLRDSDYVIVNNKDAWDKFGRLPRTINISNGVNISVFNIRKPPELRKPRVLWIGSLCHRRTKNYDKILVPLSKMLQRDRIAFDFRLVDSCGKNRMNQDQMVNWYNTGSVYVVASQSEGTPNPLIESSACGCVPVSTRVGNAPELIQDGVNGFLCNTTVQSLYDGIKKAIANYKPLSINMQETIKDWSWEKRSKQYYDFFRKIIDERRNANNKIK